MKLQENACNVTVTLPNKGILDRSKYGLPTYLPTYRKSNTTRQLFLCSCMKKYQWALHNTWWYGAKKNCIVRYKVKKYHNTGCDGPTDRPTYLPNYQPTANELYVTVCVTGWLVICSCVKKYQWALRNTSWKLTWKKWARKKYIVK